MSLDVIPITLGAPDPIVLGLRINGTLVSLDNTLTFTYANDAGKVTLRVGEGITLSDAEGVTNGRAKVRLTVAQSRAIPLGALTSFEVQRIDGGDEDMWFSGMLEGRGGVNPDG